MDNIIVETKGGIAVVTMNRPEATRMMGLDDALEHEARLGGEILRSGESHEGALRFASGKGRHGGFTDTGAG